jgi:hypothetical protein
LESAAREFLFRLLKTPSPSGYEQPIQELVREYLERCADTVTTDSHGNVIGAKNASAPTRMLLAGHCDQIGLIVQYIDSDGFISVQPIGGWDPIQLVGSRVTIWTKGGPVTGVMSRKPIHLLTEEERKQVPKMKDLWIDIGAENKADCESVVRVGDAVTLELEVRQLRRDLCCSVAMDDKVGLWVVLEAFRRAAAAVLAERLGQGAADALVDLAELHHLRPRVGVEHLRERRAAVFHTFNLKPDGVQRGQNLIQRGFGIKMRLQPGKGEFHRLTLLPPKKVGKADRRRNALTSGYRPHRRGADRECRVSAW